jgi:Chaperone for flagella basal body P-ring formation
LMTLLPAWALRAAVCPSAGSGARANHLIVDAALHREWEAVVDCAHPERPWIWKAIPWQASGSANSPTAVTASPSSPKVIVIRAGSRIRLWGNAESGSIQLTGTAIDSGAIGEQIHIRAGAHGGVLAGIVRGSGSAELAPIGQWRDNRSPEE